MASIDTTDSIYAGAAICEGAVVLIAVGANVQRYALDVIDPAKHNVYANFVWLAGLTIYFTANVLYTIALVYAPASLCATLMATIVQPRLRKSLELIANATGEQAELERWWHRAMLPTSMGGDGVGGQEALCGAAYCAAIFSVWPRLQANGTAFTNVGFDLDYDSIPMLDEFCIEYAALRKSRSRTAAIHAEFEQHIYHTIRVLRRHRTAFVDGAAPSCSACQYQGPTGPHPLWVGSRLPTLLPHAPLAADR